MQTETLASNSHKQFYVLLNTNQTKLYTCPDLLKENFYLENFPAQNENPLHFRRDLYTHIYHFSQ